jgi:hypothetical protein
MKVRKERLLPAGSELSEARKCGRPRTRADVRRLLPLRHLRLTVLSAASAARAAKPSTAPPLSRIVTQGDAPAKGKTVVVSDGTGKVVYRIVTDHLGRYFSGDMPPGPVSVRVEGQTLQTTIGAGQGAVLNVKL